MATAEEPRTMNVASQRDPHNNNSYGTLVDSGYVNVDLPVLDVNDFNDRIINRYEAGQGEKSLPADLSVARSLVPVGTAALRDFSYVAPDIPEFIAPNCTGCMECVTECPDTAILGKVLAEPDLENKLRDITDEEDRPQRRPLRQTLRPRRQPVPDTPAVERGSPGKLAPATGTGGIDLKPRRQDQHNMVRIGNQGPSRKPIPCSNRPLTSVAERLQVRTRKSCGFRHGKLAAWMLSIAVACSYPINVATADPLRAGVAKIEITEPSAKPLNDPLFVKALVIGDGTTTLAIVTVDAVAIGEIGHIKNDYLGNVRSWIREKLNIEPANVMINASHCHGVVRADVDQRTCQAVQEAARNMVPVKVGAGTGQEDRIMENRRLKLKNGREADVRHAYSLPPDEEVAAIGPVDPQIGILRLDRQDGRTLAVVYNFACHPIQGVPNGGNTADITGFASQVIEDNLSDGTIALFLQGCGGDINPIDYKDVNHTRNAEPLGNMLGLSTLRALKKVRSKEGGRLTVLNETIELPRADVGQRILALAAEQTRLMRSLGGTSLNLKTFIPLFVKYNVSGEFPSYDSHRYLHDRALGRDDLNKLDAENRRNMKQYIRNIHTMEQLTRINTNLDLLRKHQADFVAGGKRTLRVELLGIRIGDFVLTTFPGELTVQIGLNIKKKSPHPYTFVAGYTNGYIYYAPTAEQLKNVGGAQEDSDCLLAPEWQKMYEEKVAEILGRL